MLLFFDNDNDNKGPVISYGEGGGKKRTGVKAMSDSLQDGAKLFL